MGLACRFVNEQTAKDLVQEVFASYWERKQDIDAENIQSYFYKWIQNRCLNYLKHQMVVADYESSIRIAEARIKYLENVSDTNEILKQVMTQDITDKIKEAMAKLPSQMLALEGDRWYDLIRWGITRQALEEHKKPYVENFVETKHLLFPIPHNEFLLNPD